MAADANDLNQRWEALRTKRSSWDVAWDDLSRHFLPFKFRSDMDSDAGRKPEILNKKIVDTTGILDMRTLAAGMQGGMTSPVRPWFKITLEDEEAAKQHEAGEWLDEDSSFIIVDWNLGNHWKCSWLGIGFCDDKGGRDTAGSQRLDPCDHPWAGNRPLCHWTAPTKGTA